MRKEGNYVFGTIAEIAADYASRIKIDFSDEMVVPEFDFKVAEIETENLEEMYNDNVFIYGVKRIDSGFGNSNGVDLFCDYYGGGCGHCCNIEIDGEDEWVSEIENMILATLSYSDYSEQVMLICEYE